MITKVTGELRYAVNRDISDFGIQLLNLRQVAEPRAALQQQIMVVYHQMPRTMYE